MGFFDLLYTEMWNKDIVCTPFDVPMPKFFADQSILGSSQMPTCKSWPLKSERKYNFTHIFEKQKLMMPKSCKTQETHKFYFLSPSLFVL